MFGSAHVRKLRAPGLMGRDSRTCRGGRFARRGADLTLEEGLAGDVKAALTDERTPR